MFDQQSKKENKELWIPNRFLMISFFPKLFSSDGKRKWPKFFPFLVLQLILWYSVKPDGCEHWRGEGGGGGKLNFLTLSMSRLNGRKEKSWMLEVTAKPGSYVVPNWLLDRRVVWSLFSSQFIFVRNNEFSSNNSSLLRKTKKIASNV